MMPWPTRPLSEASASTSISTGKERDAESGQRLLPGAPYQENAFFTARRTLRTSFALKSAQTLNMRRTRIDSVPAMPNRHDWGQVKWSMNPPPCVPF